MKYICVPSMNLCLSIKQYKEKTMNVKHCFMAIKVQAGEREKKEQIHPSVEKTTWR